MMATKKTKAERSEIASQAAKKRWAKSRISWKIFREDYPRIRKSPQHKLQSQEMRADIASIDLPAQLIWSGHHLCGARIIQPKLCRMMYGGL